MASDQPNGRRADAPPGDDELRARRMAVARMRGDFYFRPRPGAVELLLPDAPEASAKHPRKRSPQLNRVIKSDHARRVADEIIDHIRDDETATVTLEAALNASAAGESAQAMIRDVAALADERHDAGKRRAVASLARALADETAFESVRRVAGRLDDPIVRSAMATSRRPARDRGSPRQARQRARRDAP